MGGPDPDGDYDNLQLTGTPYVQRRSPKDRAWVWALGALYAGCLITSIYAWKHRWVKPAGRACFSAAGRVCFSWCSAGRLCGRRLQR
jgi:hypothetical protein